MVLVARDAGRLAAMAAELENRYGAAAETIAADLTDDAGVAAVVARLTDPRPAGGDPGQQRGDRPAEVLRGQRHRGREKAPELHVETAMELTHAALQGMLARQSGRIINVASVAAFLPRGTYSAAKAWLLSFSRSANMLYKARGVQVTAVCPGFTHTEFHDRMGMDKTVAPRWMWLDARQVVSEGLADNAKGKAVSIPSRRYKVLTSVTRVLPARLVAGPPRRANSWTGAHEAYVREAAVRLA